MITFDVIDAELPYNTILSRPTLIKFMAADHDAYHCMKIPRPTGAVITVRGDLRAALDYQEKSLTMIGQLLQRGSDPTPRSKCKKDTPLPGGSSRAMPLEEKDSPRRDAMNMSYKNAGLRIKWT